MRFCIFLSGDRGIASLSHFLKENLRPIEVYIDKSNYAAQRKVYDLFGGSVNVVTVSGVNDDNFVHYLTLLELDFCVVAGFPTIFRDGLLRATRCGIINQHAGRLPAYRGGSPLNWQIINGERNIGISVIKMNEGIDSGQVLACGEFALSAEEDISHAHSKANELFGRLTVEAIDRLLSCDYLSAEMVGDPVYWHQRNDADGVIDWNNMRAEQIVNLVRAIAPPYSGAHCFSSGLMVRVYRASIPHETFKGVPGRVFFVQGKGPLVCAADRAVLLRDYKILQLNDSESMLEPSRLRTGDRLKGML